MEVGCTLRWVSFYLRCGRLCLETMQGDSHRPVTSTQLAHSRNGFCHQGFSVMMVFPLPSITAPNNPDAICSMTYGIHLTSITPFSDMPSYFPIPDYH